MNKKHTKKRISDQDREIGKTRIFIILGMIIVGLAIAIYKIQ